MKFRKEDLLIYITLTLLIATLIRIDFLPLFGFSFGLLLGNLNKIEKWYQLKDY